MVIRQFRDAHTGRISCFLAFCSDKVNLESSPNWILSTSHTAMESPIGTAFFLCVCAFVHIIVHTMALVNRIKVSVCDATPPTQTHTHTPACCASARRADRFSGRWFSAAVNKSWGRHFSVYLMKNGRHAHFAQSFPVWRVDSGTVLLLRFTRCLLELPKVKMNAVGL